MKKLALLIIGLFLTGTIFAAYPNYDGYINDFADILTTEQEAALETKLTTYEEQTTNEIAVVTVKTTEPESIEEYSINLAEQWKPGQVGKDNGVLMVFAMDDRKMRNEVGRGLEGSLTDITSKHIQDETIAPEFKKGNYYEGIDKGIDRIIVAVSPDSPIATLAALPEDGMSGAVLLFLFVIFGVAIVFYWIAFNHDQSSYEPLITGSTGFGSYYPRSTYSSPSPGRSSYTPSSYDSDDDDSGGGYSPPSSFGGGKFSGGGSTSSW